MLAGPGDFKGDPANMVPRDRKKQLVTQTEGVSLQNTFWLAQPSPGAGVHRAGPWPGELLLAQP